MFLQGPSGETGEPGPSGPVGPRVCYSDLNQFLITYLKMFKNVNLNGILFNLQMIIVLFACRGFLDLLVERDTSVFQD